MPEPDYKTIFYRSQSKFCDAIDQLREVVLRMEESLRELEELVIADDNEPEQ